MRTFSMYTRVRIGIPILTALLATLATVRLTARRPGLDRRFGDDAAGIGGNGGRTSKPAAMSSSSRTIASRITSAGRSRPARRPSGCGRTPVLTSACSARIVRPLIAGPTPRGASSRSTYVTENPQGRRQTIEVDPTVVDALFFTQSAIDKFLIPY